MEQHWQNATNCRSRVLKRLVVYVICNLIKYLFHMLMLMYIQNSINRFAINTYTRL